MSDTTSVRRDTHIELSAAVADSSQISVNVGQEFITTTRDKTELALLRYEKALRTRDQWIAPVGILFAVLPSLLGAQFTDFLGIKKAVWEAAYMLVALGAGAWFVRCAHLAYTMRSRRDIELVIKEMCERQSKDRSYPPDV